MSEQADILATCLLRIDSDGLPGLEEFCAQHPAHASFLRERVGELIGLGLVSSDHGESSIESPKQIGRYRILSVLGHGGMGTVFLGVQDEPIRRQVAVKVVKLGMDTQRVIARFELERSTLAMMQHPAIANVFEAGITRNGRPFFAMEYVDGIALTEHCDERRLGLRQRLDLFMQACHAVQHAHYKGVLHRDLKPSNMLAFEKEGGHGIKLIDFGLARAMNADTERSLFTEAGALIGTPEYMSPEQAAGSDVDARADIYSLGSVLYELLTGVLPFESDSLRQQSYASIVHTLQEVDPPNPSARVRHGEQTVDRAAKRRSVPSKLARRLRGDLDWIVMRAIAKDPERRYASPGALTRDLERYLAHEPVDAGPPGTLYLLRKFTRRYRVQVTAAALVVLTVIIGGLLADAGRRAANRELARFEGLAVFADIEVAKREAKPLIAAWPHDVGSLQDWIDRHGESLASRIDYARTLHVRLEDHQAAGEIRLDQADTILLGVLRRGRAELQDYAGTTLANMRHRLQWSMRSRQLTLEHPDASAAWSAAREAIARADGVVASERYADDPIDLQPQLGLVPIGMNPVTKLWEFYHLRSAVDLTSNDDPGALSIPRHRQDGSVEVGDDTGIVFVLVPGGTFLIGAQSTDENAPNYYARAHVFTMPTHRITLAPFFLARHEMTQGQWSRLTIGDNPSRSKPGKHWQGNPRPTTWRHPVEQVSWSMAREGLSEHGLLLPTEAQWEYACRARTQTIWYTGSRPSSLAGYENLADQTFGNNGGIETAHFNDGWGLGSSPVGTYRANPFGFFDMLGNVQEWCRDRFAGYGSRRVAPETGERIAAGEISVASKVVTRGGSSICDPVDAHCALRWNSLPHEQNYCIGLRASRALTDPR